MLEDAAGIRRVVLACGTVDLRKGIDGLAMVIGDKYKQNPFRRSAGAWGNTGSAKSHFCAMDSLPGHHSVFCPARFPYWPAPCTCKKQRKIFSVLHKCQHIFDGSASLILRSNGFKPSMRYRYCSSVSSAACSVFLGHDIRPSSNRL